MKHGLFISFEGAEASGKSTQLALAAAAFRQRGHDVVATREPGGTVIGDQIRAVLLAPEHAMMCATTELLLYAAGRAQHIADVIVPALQRGAIVLCDRYADATYAYQGGARGLPTAMLDDLHRLSTNDLWPDVTFLLDLSPTESCARMTTRGKHRDRLEQESQDFHTAVRRCYLARAAAYPRRFVVLDALQPQPALHTQILENIEQRLCGNK